MDQALQAAADEAGIGYINLTSTLVPRLAEYLLDAVKRHAKALRKKLPSSMHTQCLEALSVCAGFAQWHAMQTTLQRMADSESVDPSSMAPLAKCLRMLIQLPPEVPPNEKQKATLERFASELATELKASEPVVRDALAFVYGAKDWGGLSGRDISASSSPLYGIRRWDGRMEPPGEASFTESAACRRLVAQQDAWFLQDEFPNEEARRPQPDDAVNAKELAALLDKRQDFLYGYLVLGQVLKDRGDEKYMTVLADGVRRGMQLLEQHGVRSMNWGSLSNRFFHRLLYALMEASEELNPADAVKLAEWLMALNPSDNLGVRDHYVRLRTLELIDSKTVNSRLTGLGAWMPGVRGHFLIGLLMLSSKSEMARTYALEHLLLAVFQAPALRELVMKRRFMDPSAYPEKFLVPVSLDEMSYLADQVSWWSEHEPSTLTLARKLLKSPEVVQAEADMTALRLEDPSRWQAACTDIALRVAHSVCVKRKG
ncbi:hypothetical protein [Paucibacter soli]|uniref:hypothetical protein n=1 Tax=Paucibacter soli TaxID=3133433 RepID=UPI0030A44748